MARSVYVIGWSTILLSFVVILSELVSLSSNTMMNQLEVLFQMFPQARVGSMSSVIDLFWYSRMWSIYTIMYFIVVLAGSIQFVRLRTSGRTILEIACWVGMVNACVDSLLSYILWNKMQAMMSAVIGSMGMPLGSLNPLGIVTIIIGFFLWIIPSIGMIVYLRRPKLRMLMK